MLWLASLDWINGFERWPSMRSLVANSLRSRASRFWTDLKKLSVYKILVFASLELVNLNALYETNKWVGKCLKLLLPLSRLLAGICYSSLLWLPGTGFCTTCKRWLSIFWDTLVELRAYKWSTVTFFSPSAVEIYVKISIACGLCFCNLRAFS